jgi:Glycoside hydrolase family 5 C-terminal domain
LDGGAPSLVGECGIAYDMNDAAAYAAWAAGDRTDAAWAPQIAALELMYDALDALGLHSTHWNYTVSNRNDPMIGDGWNQEDLSVWSIDQATDTEDPNSGGRAVRGFCRPHAHAVQGTPVFQHFDMPSGAYELRFEADPATDAPTEIYAPAVQYPWGFHVEADNATLTGSDGPWLRFKALRAGTVAIILRRRAA